MSEVRIACVGDIMCGEWFSKVGWGVSTALKKHGRAFLAQDVADVLRSHDLVLGNIECVLSEVGRRENSLRSLHMRGRSESARLLADWGITLGHVANNHILEHGVEAARDTARHLEAAGIRAVGAGRDNQFDKTLTAVPIETGPSVLSVIGVCFHPGEYAHCPGTLEQLTETVRQEKEKGRVVLVSVHWGDELIDRPSLWQRWAARQLVQAGAKMVVGHHAHVFQGVETIDNSLVAYSTGNFIFDCCSRHLLWTAILSITLQEGVITGWETIPVTIESDYRPMLATGSKKAFIHEEIARRCTLMGLHTDDTEDDERAYRSEVESLEMADRKCIWAYIFKNWFRYRPVLWPQLILRPILRRLGRW